MAEDSKRAAIRELKYFGNMMKGLIAYAAEMEDDLDADKRAAELRAEIEELKAQRANYTDLQAEIAAGKSELASITAQIDSVRAKFKNG